MYCQTGRSLVRSGPRRLLRQSSSLECDTFAFVDERDLVCLRNHNALPKSLTDLMHVWLTIMLSRESRTDVGGSRSRVLSEVAVGMLIALQLQPSAQNHQFEHSTNSICEIRDQSVVAAISRGEI